MVELLQTNRLARPDLTKASLGVTKLSVIPLTYLFCVVLLIGFHLGPLYLTTLRIMLMLLAVPLFGMLLAGKFGRLNIADFLFVAHIMWMGLALWVNNPNQMVTQIGSVGIEFIGGYLIGRAYIRSRSDFIALCQWLCLIVLLMSPFAIYETMTGKSIIIEAIRRLPGISTVPINNYDKRMGLFRVQGTFSHPIHYGLFCSVVFSLCFVALKDVYTTSKRWTYSIIIMINGFLALSSGALLAMALQLFLIGWYLVFEKQTRRWWMLVGLFIAMYIFIDIFSNRTPIQVFMSYATFSAGTAYWRGLIFEWGLLNIIGDRSNDIPAALWLGIGINDWIRPAFMHTSSVDNFWLLMGMRYGLPGLLFLMIGYVVIIAKVMRRNFEDDPEMSRIRRAWVFTFIGLTFTLCTVHVWTNVYSFVFFIFGAGVWITTETAKSGSSVPEETKIAAAPSGSTRYSRFPTIRNRQANAKVTL